MADKLKYEILQDGTIKWNVEGAISEENHTKATAFFEAVARLLGGDVTVEHLNPDHHHEQIEEEFESQV